VNSTILLSPSDNVAVASRDIAVGTTLLGNTVAVKRIASGHKVAIRAITGGAAVIKYAQTIGRALVDVRPGEHVHSHNLVFDYDRVPGRPLLEAFEPIKIDRPRTFMGYRRPDGRAGTRNFIGIVASVNCSSTVCRTIADRANQVLLPLNPGVDGFVPIMHNQGCGMSATGEGMRILHRTLAGYLRHPNFGGVLMVGLGCEVNQLILYGQKGISANKRHFNIQEAGRSRKSVEIALGVLTEIAKAVAPLTREPIPVSEIVLGLQCGGSDGLSGITANPALGIAVDMLVCAGGTGVLSETPEIFGAEYLLTSRAVTPEIGNRLRGYVSWWEKYAAMHGASLDNNPSPGNKRGGLTTILEKSLGAIAKGGHTPVRGAVGYAERVTERGLVFMDTPGYDPVSATGQVAGGANVIAFTTGRGSCFGCRPTPSIKIASNSALYHSMEDDMDVDAGVVASGERTVAETGRDIFEMILETASGRKTKSEAFGYGDNEFVPWHLGATL
jgi:altronate hydrolase